MVGCGYTQPTMCQSGIDRCSTGRSFWDVHIVVALVFRGIRHLTGNISCPEVQDNVGSVSFVVVCLHWGLSNSSSTVRTLRTCHCSSMCANHLAVHKTGVVQYRLCIVCCISWAHNVVNLYNCGEVTIFHIAVQSFVLLVPSCNH